MPVRLRNPLFAPGDSARKLDKALASAADAVILDLEDSVASPAKDAARAGVVALLASRRDRPGLVVRVDPSRSSAPGFRFWTSTSARDRSSRKVALSSVEARSRIADSLPRFSRTKELLCPPGATPS